MKLKAKILAVAVCAMALCVALVGCAGGGNNGDAAANFQGDIQLNEGGQAVISLFGTNTDGTWEAKDATTVALTFEGDTADAKLEGDELVLSVDGSSLKFKKGTIPAEAAAGTGATDDAGQAAE